MQKPRPPLLLASFAPAAENRPYLTGSVEQVREDVRQLGKWGVTEIFFAWLDRTRKLYLPVVMRP